MTSTHIETERKFVIDEHATIPTGTGTGTTIQQGYLTCPTDSISARIRVTEHEATLTVKIGDGLCRTEHEQPLDNNSVATLWQHTAGRRLTKTRHRIPLDDGNTADVDIYTGHLRGLRVAEVEFGNIDDANTFQPPDWFGRDVTNEPGWSNAELAHTGPPPHQNTVHEPATHTPTSTHDDTPDNSTATPADVLRAMVAAFDTGNVNQLETVVHPNYIDHQGLPGQRPLTGIDEFRRVVDVARNNYTELAVNIEDIIEDGDRAAARLSWNGVEHSGETTYRETIEIVRVTSGRATEHWGGHS